MAIVVRLRERMAGSSALGWLEVILIGSLIAYLVAAMLVGIAAAFLQRSR